MAESKLVQLNFEKSSYNVSSIVLMHSVCELKLQCVLHTYTKLRTNATTQKYKAKLC